MTTAWSIALYLFALRCEAADDRGGTDAGDFDGAGAMAGSSAGC